jgi:hypothetical protein
MRRCHLPALILVNVAGIMGRTGIAQDQAFFELKQSIGMNPQWMDDVLIHSKFHEIEATEHRGVLILPAASDVKIVALGLVSYFCKFVQIPLIAPKLIEATKDGCGYHSRTSQPGVHGEVRVYEQIETKVWANGS